MADPKSIKAADAVEAKPEPKLETTLVSEKPVVPFIPGVKQLPNKLNGKQSGRWTLRNHEGKIVHGTDDADEAVHLFKMFAVNGHGSADDDFPGKFWGIHPYDPRKENDKEWQKERERRNRRAGR
jgi:hypothetical protein